MLFRQLIIMEIDGAEKEKEVLLTFCSINDNIKEYLLPHHADLLIY